MTKLGGMVLGISLLIGTAVAEAGPRDWPVVGQVARVAECVVGESGVILADLVGKLTEFVANTVTVVGQCAISITGEVTDVVTDVITLQNPTPDIHDAGAEHHGEATDEVPLP